MTFRERKPNTLVRLCFNIPFTSQNDLCVWSHHSTPLHSCLEENVLLSLFLALLLSYPVYKLSISEEREAVSMATCKGHLQEVLCERVQNVSWIIRLTVMTDNRPQLIREKEEEMGWGDRQELLDIEQRNNRAFIIWHATLTHCVYVCFANASGSNTNSPPSRISVKVFSLHEVMQWLDSKEDMILTLIDHCSLDDKDK